MEAWDGENLSFTHLEGMWTEDCLSMQCYMN
jgi:hypothetical protein